MVAKHIFVRSLSKTYRVPVREAGLMASIKSLWLRQYRDVEAVKDINFSIDEGEIIGFLGPNGAGKTTTLKMLAGLLYPTTGEIGVAGFTPWKREVEYRRCISMVMGNRSQLAWDIPPKDSFLVLGEIYRVPAGELKRTIDELVDLLDLTDLLTKPVRSLSLGERMKCELVAALLHRPRVLFLDEPTLGLDITMQGRLRRFIAEYNRRHNATIILTSHYMADVEALCPRIIMINQGRLIYDGGLQELAKRLAPHKQLRLILDEEQMARRGEPVWPEGVEVIVRDEYAFTLHVRQSEVPFVTGCLLQTLPVVDLAIEESPIEAIIERAYQQGGV